MKKKFSLFLVFMLTLLTWVGGINPQKVKAVTIGEVLIAPEKGWQRFDDSDSKIQYIGTGWGVGPYVDKKYNNYSTISTVLNDKIKIKFVGTKLRLIMSTANTSSNNIGITIDGIEYGNINTYISPATAVYQAMVFEKTGLENKLHTVILTNNQSGYNLNFDALDIDDTGYLVDPSTVIAESISLDKTSLNMLEGTTEKLTATVLPENTTNKKVTWTSSDSSVAFVDENGNVVAIKEGQAIITATTTDGTNLTATCNVTVTKPVTNWANLEITMTNGQIKKYNLPMVEVDKFINWYIQRVAGTGKPFYEFVKTTDIAPFIKKTEYIIFDKISSFEVNEYKVQ
ncbi:Ig-like domain-containing protein [Desnuesiella massiliensis]|uniref:Ig-like domain-containing protein n=1 Tax=Desnuesiella massiliensis TaxID=1650662 RepID=UPI0006E16E47|nr:Ig-like domain-containing protein [Desnuesiella massiliensis]